MLRPLLFLLVLAASSFAAPRAAEPAGVDVAVEAYLDETDRYGFHADQAGGGVEGWVSVRLLAWYPAIRGTGDDDGGGEFDVRSDLGLDEREWGVIPQVTVNFLIFGFRIDYYHLGFDGQGRIDNGFEFGGLQFVVGEDVDSSLDLDSFRSLGIIRFLDNDTVSLGGILGLQWYEYRATIRGEISGSSTLDGVLPFPVVGALAQVRVFDALLEAELSGFAIHIGDLDLVSVDFTVSAAWSILKMGEVRVGYRFVSFDGTIDDAVLDLQLDGFFLGVGFTF